MRGRPSARGALRGGPRALAAALATTLCMAAGAGTSPARADGPATQGAVSFALIGDLPYFALEVPMVGQIFDSLDEDIAFVVHAGDLKGSWESCDDALLAERHALLDRSPVPLVFTPGDNEWADCHHSRAGGFDPLERLAALRRLFFADADALGGRPGLDAESAPGVEPLVLRRQADATPGGPPENLRWRAGGTLFATINLPGSRNAREVEKRHPGSRAARERWNEAWLREAYAIATRDRLGAIVVIGQANPHFGRSAGGHYASFQRLLEGLAARFPGHTLFLHGDTHRHSVERLGERLLRVESYGSPFSNLWVRIDVDPAADEPFRITSRRTDPDPPRP
ncbi:metallophosphoesterase family protein [Zeimonas arvi]|uniref:Metallophosphoesterase n=1 Tax=Zeimonas arvi TaxID=2498847 RepID=A0A5C8NNK2_9BURK|nr:metallophosphoesterase family protein [Zeimonas arvi]TXL62657.1 metallophosphoesterase [Zeimonas arvi]